VLDATWAPHPVDGRWLRLSRVGPLEVGEHQDVEQLNAGSRPEGIQALADSALEFIWAHEKEISYPTRV
jgi:hypothetical protein